ncbi:MAG: hypothetical protein HQ592_10925 [Planctomycetes bacterium]|nr:hypothetical protein [Planctomycetota bacterium]
MKHMREHCRIMCDLLSVALCLLLFGCSAVMKRSVLQNSDAKAVLAELEAMPDWSSLRAKKQTRKQRRIEQSVKRIAEHNLGDIRAAMECYIGVSKEDPLSVDGKLLILNRYVFDVPTTVRRDSSHFAHVITGWWSQPMSCDPYDPQDSDEISSLWPWSKNEKGELRLTGRANDGGIAIHRGPRIGVLGDFDYYREHFGRREFPADQKAQE